MFSNSEAIVLYTLAEKIGNLGNLLGRAHTRSWSMQLAPTLEIPTSGRELRLMF